MCKNKFNHSDAIPYESARQCNCGAVTVYFDGKTNSSMSEETFLSIYGVNAEPEGNKFYNCNHCVNHWGIDLCECGSGETPESCCKGGTSQVLGNEKTFIGWQS